MAQGQEPGRNRTAHPPRNMILRVAAFALASFASLREGVFSRAQRVGVLRLAAFFLLSEGQD
jgi:hypothetical protein